MPRRADAFRVCRMAPERGHSRSSDFRTRATGFRNKTMRIIPLQFPDCRVFGQLVESKDPHDLSEDMVEIELPNGILSDAGWYPESSPAGRYRIAAGLGLDSVAPPLFTKDVKGAEEHIRRLVRDFSQGV